MADQWNDNTPAVGNQISNDIPDIEENFAHLKNILESICNQTWSDTDATVIFPSTMKDADGDTRVEVETTADVDQVRFVCSDSAVSIIGASGLFIDTINERTAANGVAIDGLTIKDGALVTADSVDTAQLADAAVNEARLASNSVSQAKLKDATEEESTALTSDTNLAFSSVGSFGFYPQIKTSNVACIPDVKFTDGASAIGTSYITQICLKSSGGYTTYAQIRYISSSGEVWWLFFLTDKENNVLCARSGQEHPCYGNGGKPMVHPHPFMDYDPQKHNIYVCNPNEELLDEIKDRIPSGKDDVPDRSILQVINEDYELDLAVSPDWPSIPITVGFAKDSANLRAGEEVEVIKRVVPQPDYIKTCWLKLRR